MITASFLHMNPPLKFLPNSSPKCALSSSRLFGKSELPSDWRVYVKRRRNSRASMTLCLITANTCSKYIGGTSSPRLSASALKISQIVLTYVINTNSCLKSARVVLGMLQSSMYCSRHSWRICFSEGRSRDEAQRTSIQSATLELDVTEVTKAPFLKLRWRTPRVRISSMAWKQL